MKPQSESYRHFQTLPVAAPAFSPASTREATRSEDYSVVLIEQISAIVSLHAPDRRVGAQRLQLVAHGVQLLEDHLKLMNDINGNRTSSIAGRHIIPRKPTHVLANTIHVSIKDATKLTLEIAPGSACLSCCRRNRQFNAWADERVLLSSQRATSCTKPHRCILLKAACHARFLGGIQNRYAKFV